MEIREAQWEMRWAFLGGFGGQLVSGLLWLASAALATWGTPRSAIVLILVGGFFIFPLTQATVRLSGRPGRVGPGNALHGLGAQVAMVLPLTLPLVGAAALYRIDWFYPAFMVALGAHYLPFVFLYGMRMFGVLCAILVAAGILMGTTLPMPFATGAWFTAAVLLAFAFVGRASVLREEGERSPPVASGPGPTLEGPGT